MVSVMQILLHVYLMLLLLNLPYIRSTQIVEIVWVLWRLSLVLVLCFSRGWPHNGHFCWGDLKWGGNRTLNWIALGVWWPVGRRIFDAHFSENVIQSLLVLLRYRSLLLDKLRIAQVMATELIQYLLVASGWELLNHLEGVRIRFGIIKKLGAISYLWIIHSRNYTCVSLVLGSCTAPLLFFDLLDVCILRFKARILCTLLSHRVSITFVLLAFASSLPGCWSLLIKLCVAVNHALDKSLYLLKL